MSLSLLPSIFLQVCLPLMLVVGVGFFMDRRFKLNLESLVKLNLYVMVPAFIFARLLDTPMAGHEAGRIMLAAFSTLMLCGVVSFFVGRALHLNGAAQKAHSLASMLGNCGNFGLPLVTLAFGKEAAAVQVYVLVTMNVSTFTVGLFLANADARGGWRSHARPRRCASPPFMPSLRRCFARVWTCRCRASHGSGNR